MKHSPITTVIVASVLAFAAGVAPAQHIDFLVWDDGGALGVGQYDFDFGIPSDTRVQSTRLLGGSGADAFTSDAPGFISLGGADALPGNENLMWDFLPMTVAEGAHAGYRSTLLYWDPFSGPIEFGPTVTDDYRFAIGSLIGYGEATGADEIEPGDAIVRTSPSGSIHEHPIFFLDDNGDGVSTTAPAPGIYLVALQLAIGDLAPSDPAFLVVATPEPSFVGPRRLAVQWVEDRVDTMVAEPLEGDFNGDGRVDAADYTVWRDGVGTTHEPVEYGLWTENYGAAAPGDASMAAATPEPTGVALAALLTVGAVGFRPRLVSSSRA